MISPYSISGWLAGFASVGFGLFVLRRAPDRRLGLVWFLFTLSVAAYGFGVAWIGVTKTPEVGMIAWQVTYGLGVLWIPPLFYSFVSVFLDRVNKKALIVHFLIAFLFLLSLRSRYFFDHVSWFHDSFYYARGGALYPIYLAWWFGLVTYVHWLMIRAYRTVSWTKQKQLQYFLCSTVVGFLGGSFGYFANLGIDYYPWGNFTVCLYPLIMSMAILRHQMLDITLIIRKTLLYSGVSLILTAVYFFLTVLTTRVLEGSGSAARPYASAAAAAAMAILGHPVYTRVRRWVDRQFPHEKLDQEMFKEATSTFAHEIKRPLASISAPAELVLTDLTRLLGGEEAPEKIIPVMQSRIRHVLKKTFELAETIEALRGLATETAEQQPLDIAEVVRRVAQEFEKRQPRHAIPISIESATNGCLVQGNLRQMEVALSNLLRNAEDALAGSSDPKIVIRMTGGNHRVQIRVRDTGPGIAPERLASIFRPYVTSKVSGGMGLGLCIVSQIVERHGGTIQVESELGRGSEFIINLPCSDKA